MEKNISYNQITVQNGKVKKNEDGNIVFTLKNEIDYPIILYKIWKNINVQNNVEQIYKTTLQSWVKLYANYNFRNKVQFTPITKITIGRNVYAAKLFNADLDALKRPILFFKPIKNCNKSFPSIPCGKFKEMQFVIDFSSNVTPDLIRYFMPPQIDLPKANTISENIYYPYIPQLQPYTGITYNGIYIDNIPTYNGVISISSQPYLKNNYNKPPAPEYNGVQINKPNQQEIDKAITTENLNYIYNYGNILMMSGKVTA